MVGFQRADHTQAQPAVVTRPAGTHPAKACHRNVAVPQRAGTGDRGAAS